MVIVKRKTPGSHVATHTRREKTSRHKCTLCGSILHGMKRGTNSEIRSATKSQRRPERPYGGQLCTRCTRKVLIVKAKILFGIIKPEEVSISLRDYVGIKEDKK